MITLLKAFAQDERGLELSEYALAAALITLALLLMFTALGNNVAGVINNLAGNIK